MIRTLENHPLGSRLTSFLARFWRDGTFPTDLDTRETVSDPTAPVEVNHSRWIVRCPFCPSAQLAHDGDRRFMCVECHNQTVDGKWVPVGWPEADVRDDIEGLLEVRPTPKTRNWREPETVEDLEAENAERGL